MRPTLDEALRRLSPHKRPPTHRALLTADEASCALGMPVWQIANLKPVIVGKRVCRYLAKDVGLKHPKAKDLTVPQVAYRWGVSPSLVRRMIAAKTLETQQGTRPVVIKAASIRKRENRR